MQGPCKVVEIQTFLEYFDTELLNSVLLHRAVLKMKTSGTTTVLCGWSDGIEQVEYQVWGMRNELHFLIDDLAELID